ncbi:4-hydroxyphenylacetate catabolism regulatory protein HpaA [Dasania sp. GY-MA-18]|uniref:4-hydroxyphenylacetate catabolism regulatory protein HpaA n=1 Tax=Dasania phycosphaerae TaxID=2950436 RepID=A0A9J6RRX8_9GAMM|nr:MULTISPECIES: 4-hydroxyphenylacetate catabolism regulatory protein HpaA [Dasania]MCR8924266.1 4-hydroxyphenylacetate catabolism regulatory protein HpaA [Dasania sp. GY-MA-18]MCZ0866919.1 4-hydroxyphenylacetate catabolism regulatory protein HpaA [Dasania phycosphaerae]MCZ0870423.1 4-hydroxyphenylacetate catabolism regulatory protein HpaA [Dasania phycosphaerae]
MANPSKPPLIPNIDIGKTYDQRYKGADIHVDTLANLADFFGADMPGHRHDRFYQIHWLKSGAVKVQLGEQSYSGSAPLFYFTPPAIPHSFQLDAQPAGLVLTVRREVVHRLVSGNEDAALERRFTVPVFSELHAVAGSLAKEAKRFEQLMEMLAEEFFERRPGRKHTLPALVNLVLVCVFRLSQLPARQLESGHEEMKIFQSFHELIEKNYKKHWPLSEYAAALNVSPSRLADICRRLSGGSSKSLVYERQIEEAKWQLIYTAESINVISDELGFKDPAYFCRFFTKKTGSSPREFRRRILSGLDGSAEQDG